MFQNCLEITITHKMMKDVQKGQDLKKSIDFYRTKHLKNLRKEVFLKELY